ELLLVLVGVTVGLIAKDATLLDEVLERGASVAPGAEAQLARGLGGGERASPPQQVEQLRRKRRNPSLAKGECRDTETVRGQQRGVELACRVEQRGERFVARRRDVVRTSGSALGGYHHRLDAVVAVDE